MPIFFNYTYTNIPRFRKKLQIKSLARNGVIIFLNWGINYMGIIKCLESPHDVEGLGVKLIRLEDPQRDDHDPM